MFWLSRFEFNTVSLNTSHIKTVKLINHLHVYQYYQTELPDVNLC